MSAAPLDTEVVVVGAGVMGLATARALARAGRNVVVCEQFELGHARGSSHGSSRIIRVSYPEERWVRLAQDAYPRWRELEAECGETLIEPNGGLDLGDWEPNRDALAACDVAHEVLDAAEVERRFSVRLEPGERALFQADAGILRADAALEALVVSARAAGATLQEHVRIEALDEETDGVVAGGIRARVVVVTAGAWAPKLVELEAVTTSETVSYFALDEAVPSVIDTTPGEHPGYALAAPGRLLKAGLHQSGQTLDPDEPPPPEPERAERTAAWVERRFPGAERTERLESCLYTIRGNDDFLLERRGRIVVGSACSGHGFKFAPVVGARLAVLAAEVL